MDVGLLSNLLLGIFHLLLAAVDFFIVLILIHYACKRRFGPVLFALGRIADPGVDQLLEIFDHLWKRGMRFPIPPKAKLPIILILLVDIRLFVLAIWILIN